MKEIDRVYKKWIELAHVVSFIEQTENRKIELIALCSKFDAEEVPDYLSEAIEECFYIEHLAKNGDIIFGVNLFENGYGGYNFFKNIKTRGDKNES